MAFDPTSVVRDYGDVLAEAAACRTSVALFDFSFVARGRLSGPQALDAIARLTRRPMADLSIGKIRYAMRAGPAGHLISDLTIWRLDDTTYEVMSGREDDILDLVRDMPRETAENLTGDSAVLSLQGPDALQALAGLCDLPRLARLSYYASTRFNIAGIDCLVGRLGYTGEAGFEIIAPRSRKAELWSLLAARARVAGFAAADILRIEAGFVLFANEFRLPVTASDVGLAAFSRRGSEHASGPFELICFSATKTERPVLWQPPVAIAPPRAIGELVVTSACHSPIAGRVLGLGYTLKRHDPAGEAPLFDPTGEFTDLKREPRPLYDRDKMRPRTPWRISGN